MDIRGRAWSSRALMSFLGLVAALFLLPSARSEAGATVLLPNLAPLPPGQLWGSQTGEIPSFGYGYPAPPVAIQGCLVDEIARSGAQRCLRFETVVVNQGRGPLEVSYRIDGVIPGAYQRLFLEDGSFKSRFAAASEFHPTHAHFHLTGFYVATLRDLNGRVVARGDKSGFCPEDGSGSGQAHYRCLGDYRTEGLQIGQVVGISAGWSDSYRMHLPDQYIEISDVDDGNYLLEIAIDPTDVIRESNERDNKVCALIKIAGENARVVKAQVACLGK